VVRQTRFSPVRIPQLRWEITSASTRRQEILELPEVALREAMVNAVCHRDYNEAGAHVMVEIFDDRVEIYNPGGLPKGLPPQDFGRHSVCRNPNIAALLLRCDYIEKMGTGIERIRAALAKADCPPVKIRFDSMFTLEFPKPTFAGEPPPQVTHQVTHQVKRLLELLQGEMTRGQLMNALGLKGRMHFSKEYLAPAMEAGYIEMTIPEKSNSRFQKYRLTTKGKTHAAK
jgi:ATP-dependent DNA helicase RecG